MISTTDRHPVAWSRTNSSAGCLFLSCLQQASLYKWAKPLTPSQNRHMFPACKVLLFTCRGLCINLIYPFLFFSFFVFLLRLPAKTLMRTWKSTYCGHSPALRTHMPRPLGWRMKPKNRLRKTRRRPFFLAGIRPSGLLSQPWIPLKLLFSIAAELAWFWFARSFDIYHVSRYPTCLIGLILLSLGDAPGKGLATLLIALLRHPASFVGWGLLGRYIS